MANTLTPQDVYQIVNAMAKQALGDGAIQAVDTTSFVAVGETLLRTGTENTLNALSTVLARTIFSTRPYRSKLQIMRTTAQRWGAYVRKVVYLWKGAEASQDYNTQLNPNQLDDGNSIDMFKINKPLALQLNFYGTKKLQKHITRFRDQLSLAFQSEDEFIRFIDGVMVEFSNEVEVLNEQKSRACMLNFMAGMSAMNLSVVDLVATFNTQMGTTYTRQQIMSKHLTEFMQHVAAQIKIYSRRLTDIGVNYHANLTNYAPIPRHTPRERQRMIMYEPMFIEAEARVFSTIFNPTYLEIGDYEGVNFWQDPNSPTQIIVKPNILNVNTGTSQDAAANVSIPFVLGLLYDEEALGVMPQFDYASTTPFNSAGGYYNMFLHWRFNEYNDFTENAVLFILGDGGAGQIDQTHVMVDNTTANPVVIDGDVTVTNTTATAIPITGTQADGAVLVTSTAAASEVSNDTEPASLSENVDVEPVKAKRSTK